MQNYTKVQKFISFLLIFSIFFSFTFQVSFFSFLQTIFASDSKTYNIVSLIVQEEIYDNIKNSVKKYAQNIQKTIPNTKTIIIPTPSDTNPFNIASLNEKLYFEWYKWINWITWISKLIWSIFIWDLALPVVENNWEFEKTVFPYVDFDDKLYVYDNSLKRYKLNENTKNTPSVEIWHWFISPNTWDEEEDIKEINDYFEKNNNFYNWEWNFKTASWLTNGKQDEELINSYEPYVFYYDQIRETQAVKYVDYKAYEWYLDNIEDLTYNRFSSALAEKLKKNYFGAQSDYIWDISTVFWKNADLSSFLGWPTTTNIPDIQTRYIIQNTTKKFLQIFNESSLWEFRKDVHNAWRYNSWTSIVNADLIPYLVTSIDTLSSNIIKNVNNDLEKDINSIVEKWISRNVAIPDNFVFGNETYTNFLYWNQAKDITSASGCTIFRWNNYNSWTLVEANRWFNVNNVSLDASLCRTWETKWYWWGNSPLNLDVSATTSLTWSIWKLKSKDYKNAVSPIYDILWSLKSEDNTKTPDPRNCFENNLILTSQYTFWESWNELSYQVPINWKSAIWWNCGAQNQKLSYTQNFDETYKNFSSFLWNCETINLTLNWQSILSYSDDNCASSQNPETWEITTQPQTAKTYNFKKIYSWIKHTSPTSDELSAQTKYMISPNLPIDKDRYIDFIAADNTYWKINYPYLFRVILNENESFNLENAKKSLKKYLDSKSHEINQLITSKNPSKLDWVDKIIFGLLKTWAYPEANIDLYKYLEDKPDKELNILWDKKTISYIDSLIFSIYWNNLNSVSAKYKFIFENYLSDQFDWNDDKYYLPKNKKQYEISYLWAPWDAQNMYVKLDPEDNWENPYSDIIANNLNLNNYLLNIANNSNANFKCAPPEWVPIWKWIPAVMCRLREMLPPKISLNNWNCWMSLINKDKDSSYFDEIDRNKNWINDYLEEELKNGSLSLKSDQSKYYYNRTWNLEAKILNASWSVITFDSFSSIDFELLKVVAPKNEDETFNEVNSKVIYDKASTNPDLNSTGALENTTKYVWFKDVSARISAWEVQYNFATKAQDANLTFKATINLKDYKWNIVISKNDIIEVEIRWDLFYATTYKLSNDDGDLSIDSWFNFTTASNSENIFLVEDESFNDLKINLNSLNSRSNSKDKLFVSLANNDRNWEYINIKYPLIIKLTDSNWENIVEPFSVNNLNTPKSIWAFKKSWIYNLEIKDITWYTIKKEIEVLPDTAIKIIPSLWTNLVEKDWVITTNVFSIYDQFDNPAIWENYEVWVSISWNSVTFEDDSKSQDFQVLEWYKPFRLKSTSNSWEANIKFTLRKNEKQKIDEKVLKLKVVDKIDFDLIWLPSELKVGNNTYNFTLKLKNYSDVDFNASAYLVSNDIYIKPINDFISINHNSWSGSFSTTTKALEKAQLEFKIEWVKDSIYKEINILPDLPVKMDLTLSKSKLEASPELSSILYVELKDRYNNIVWNDNSTKLNLEILDKYKHIIKSNVTTLTSSKWKANFTLFWTEIPWTAFFKVSTNPDLKVNKFEIPGQSPFPKSELDTIPWSRSGWILTNEWKKFFTDYDLENYRFRYYDLEILKSSDDFKELNSYTQWKITDLFEKYNKIIMSWVWENAWKIETFYFWNKQKINGKKYNSIYTTLLWSNYWDITVKDNLANSIIFDKNNRSLWVTTLLNNSISHENILNINPDGNISLNTWNNGIYQDITKKFSITQNGDLEISFFNDTFQTFVSKIYLNLKKDYLNLKTCDETDITKCFDSDNTSVFLKSFGEGYNVFENENEITLKDSSNKVLLKISNAGKISKSADITFDINENYKNSLILDLKVWTNIIWTFWLNIVDWKLNIFRDLQNLEQVKNSQEKWWIIVYLESKDYFFQKAYLWNSTKENAWISILYNDPFETNTKSLNNFSTYFEYWYEDFFNSSSLWWWWDNKILLSFASGKSMWEATKDYMTFSLINIWDPVAKLKQIQKKLPWTQKTRKFDSTIWYLISKDDDNLAYNTLDYNNDQIEDIVILKRNWYIELLEWSWNFGDFINRWTYAKLDDLKTNKTIETWDFNWNWYWDIILLNKDRKAILLNNAGKKLQRINLNLDLKWTISQIIAYDMDLDWKTDLVTLDDNGDLNIFYWTDRVWIFEKSSIANWLWIKLNSAVRNDLWAIYYSWLYQLPEDSSSEYVTSSEELYKKVMENSSSIWWEWNEFNEAIVDNLIFTKLNYNPDFALSNTSSLNLTPSIMTPEMVNGLKDENALINSVRNANWAENIDIWEWINSVEEWISSGNEEATKLLNDYPESVSVESWEYTNKVTTFIKSEYSDNVWLKIEKNFTDENSWFLKSNDRVKLNIKITNTSQNKINNIAYADKIPENFTISSNPEYSLKIAWNDISSDNIITKTPINADFSILIDSYKLDNREVHISLNPWESIEFSLSLDTNAYEYWYIKAWLFDETSNHWDIIFKDKNENCWKTIDIYKSIASRNYQKDSKENVCENNLPDSVEKNAIDKNWNWVPDYIDELIDSSKSESPSISDEYSANSINNLNKDSDWDWVPDREDVSTDYNDNEDFMNSLDSINEVTDNLLVWLDVVLAWLSCWFGWWWCIAAPINRAPLAPGQDLSLLWLPVWDWLKVWEWLPIFSAINWYMDDWVCKPSFFPMAKKWPWCVFNWAWWRLWTWSPTNFIRIFVTPTLTWAMWTAICFWWPAAIAWISNPPWLHPFVPWWNCIIAATPVFWCKNDGSDGEIYNMWEWNIINWNCSSSEKEAEVYLWTTAWDYLNYKKTWVKSNKLKNDLKDIFSTVAKWPSQKWELPNKPLLNLWDTSNGWDFSVSVDTKALKSWNFSDVVKISMKRVSPFPDFIMDWVTRQIEEIANKLTDFPTIYVILPDLSWVYDSSWKDFQKNLKDAYSVWEKKSLEKQDKFDQKINASKNAWNKIDCDKDQMWCLTNTLQTNKLELQKTLQTNTTAGWIKSAYEFMSSLPIINIEPQKVNFNIPWPWDEKTINKFILDFEATKKQWEEEFARAKKVWNIDSYNCVSTSTNTECKNMLQIQQLISSIDKNIAILKSYKEIPQSIYKMVKIKDVRIEQIICNLETITKITGWRIWDNWKRFKAWVELYILIKAILKSWQLIVDIFIDYDASCHQCKNERYDLMYFVWKLVSAVIPKIPVIQFPKWPDIYIDLHNIRALLNIFLPEFEFNVRPIIIPTLPRLHLPDSPNFTLWLPKIPLLPTFTLPNLPDLPSLPNIQLPNLPPPPKLPKIFSAIEAFLNILKLITKVMCILKSSAFVPEWRAWDQIAFITERSWYLNLDFLDISLPQFSFPFIDAIKVWSFVNLEYDTEFLVEMARQTALPVNTFTNDTVNMINIWVWDLDLRWTVPENLDVKTWLNETSFNIDKNKKTSLFNFASLIALNIVKLYWNIDKISKTDLSNEEFKKEISSNLSKIDNEKIIWVWQNALNYSFKNEDKLIKELIQNNENKWSEVKSILQEEKQKNNSLVNELKEKFKKSQDNTLVSSIKIDNISSYNSRLEKYNIKALESISWLYKEDSETKEIRNTSKEIVKTTTTALENFSKKLNESKTAFQNVKVNNDKLLATNLWITTTQTNETSTTINNSTTTTTQTTTTWTCNISQNWYSYKYKWIYIVEQFINKKISYLLFDYIDELLWDEKAKEADFDKDNDQDIIYMVWSEIYLKENLKDKKTTKDFYTWNPIILDTDENPFYSNDFIESVNWFEESINDNNYINLWFDDSTNENISNYRIEFFPMVDKFWNEENENYIPKNIKNYIIDSFRDIDINSISIEKTSNFTTRKNLAYLDSIWNLSKVTLETKELINLQNDINNNSEITINAKTKIYSSNNSVRLTYYLYEDRENELKLKSITIPTYSNIEFDDDIIVAWISSDVFVEWDETITLKWNEIASYIKKPLLAWSKIYYKDNELSIVSPYINIMYYDGTEANINFDETSYYELYDLWDKSDSYLVRTSLENWFYYGKIRSFKNNLFSTYSKQIILSPQKESDDKAPEINWLSYIRAVVNKKSMFDLTSYIYENSWINNISWVYIDTDLEKDTNRNWDNFDDKDIKLWDTNKDFNIIKEWKKIIIWIWAINELMSRYIRIYLVDENNNVWYEDINFVVYAPTAEVLDMNELKISWKIDEELENQNVSLYRIRWGWLKKLFDKSWSWSVITSATWTYNFNLKTETKNGLELYFKNEPIIKIDEYTWKINISDLDKAKYNLWYKVYSSNDESNDSVYPKIVVTKNYSPIYFEYLVTPNSWKVEVVWDFADAINTLWENKTWIYYKHSSSEYNFVSLPIWIPQNSWDLYVYYNWVSEPIFEIFKDWRINIKNEMYYLEYSTYDNYVVYKLLKKWSTNTIWEILVMPEKNYIMK